MSRGLPEFNCTVEDLREILNYLINKRRKEHRNTVMSKFETVEKCYNKRAEISRNIDQLEEVQIRLNCIYGNDDSDILNVDIT
jgi:hypothetical protein